MATQRPRNKRLMEAFHDYAVAAVDFLKGISPPELPVAFPEERWARSADLVWIRQQGVRPAWFIGLSRHEAELRRLPEYSKVVKLLGADRVIGPQIDKLVGTSTSAMAIQKERLVDGVVSSSIREDQLLFDEERFSRAYLKSEGELYAKTIESVVVSPLAGLSASPKIRFGDVELDEVTDDEAEALLSAGLLQTFQGTLPVAHTSTKYVLRLRYQLPKRIGPHEPGAEAFVGIPEATKLFQEILAVLRLFKGDRIALPGQVTLSEFFGARSRQGPSFTSSPNIFAPTYKLEPGEGRQVQRLWQRLRHPGVLKRSFIGTAVRRFGYASDRNRTEDRLVDLMIAAEGIFLGSNEIDELAYKLSMRFAHFAKVPGSTVRERFEHVKKAYRARSEIVHGDRLKTLKQDELGPFTDKTADYVRVALRQIIGEAQRSVERKTLIDWDELIIGRVATSRKPTK
jgi:hypothetical protein